MMEIKSAARMSGEEKVEERRPHCGRRKEEVFRKDSTWKATRLLLGHVTRLSAASSCCEGVEEPPPSLP